MSSAIAAIWSPETLLTFSASCIAFTRAFIWSSWLCVAKSGSVAERCNGYSAVAEPSLPRSLYRRSRYVRSASQKSTPATTLTWYLSSSPRYKPQRSNYTAFALQRR